MTTKEEFLQQLENKFVSSTPADTKVLLQKAKQACNANPDNKFAQTAAGIIATVTKKRSITFQQWKALNMLVKDAQVLTKTF